MFLDTQFCLKFPNIMIFIKIKILGQILLNASVNGFPPSTFGSEMVQFSTLHTWMDFHSFPKHYNFREIRNDNGQYCKSVLYRI